MKRYVLGALSALIINLLPAIGWAQEPPAATPPNWGATGNVAPTPPLNGPLIGLGVMNGGCGEVAYSGHIRAKRAGEIIGTCAEQTVELARVQGGERVALANAAILQTRVDNQLTLGLAGMIMETSVHTTGDTMDIGRAADFATLGRGMGGGVRSASRFAQELDDVDAILYGTGTTEVITLGMTDKPAEKPAGQTAAAPTGPDAETLAKLEKLGLEKVTLDAQVTDLNGQVVTLHEQLGTVILSKDKAVAAAAAAPTP